METNLKCRNCGHLGPSVVRQIRHARYGLMEVEACEDSVLCAHRWNLRHREAMGESTFAWLERSVQQQFAARHLCVKEEAPPLVN